MMLEVEQKFWLDLPEVALARLEMLDVEWHPEIEQVDYYFNHPARDFGVTDEALRLRSVAGQNWITYKGPKLDQATKTRRELELPLADGEEWPAEYGELLAALGFRAVREVRKTRRPGQLFHHGMPVEAAWDTIDGLGQFLELELVVEDQFAADAQAVLLDLARELHLGLSERRSYLELLLAKASGQNPSASA
jgi:adenylate cyclase, class 2